MTPLTAVEKEEEWTCIRSVNHNPIDGKVGSLGHYVLSKLYWMVLPGVLSLRPPHACQHQLIQKNNVKASTEMPYCGVQRLLPALHAKLRLTCISRASPREKQGLRALLR